MRPSAIQYLLLGILSIAVFVFLIFQARLVEERLGMPEIGTGYWLLGLIILLALFNARKRLSMVPLFQASYWLRLHVVGGVLAVAVFAVGGALGFFVDGADTRTPAHYHGVIGGINLAFYGLFYSWFLPALGRACHYPRLVRGQLILYAIGQILFIGGLFMAGSMGAARKSMGAGLEMDNLAAVAAIGLRDLGLAMAIIATAAFVILMLIALFRDPVLE